MTYAPGFEISRKFDFVKGVKFLESIKIHVEGVKIHDEGVKIHVRGVKVDLERVKFLGEHFLES